MALEKKVAPKAAEVKTEAPKAAAKVEVPKAAVKAEPEKKVEAPKAAAPKAVEAKPVVKEEAPKAAEKKAVPAKKAATAKKADPKASVVIEYLDKKIEAKEVLATATKAFTKANKGVTIKTIELYIKPEEGVAYYVVNGIGSDDYKVIL